MISSKRPSIEALVLIGLGPLIRIDLVVVAAPLLLVALGGGRGITWRGRSLVGAIVISALPSVAWQVFRMGYYGLVVPTTYLAKEGFKSRWDQGFLYLSDTYSLYLLLPVLVLGLLLTIFSLLQTASREDGVRDSWLVPGALILGGLLHTTVVCKAGGDFMHGRLLLPGLFAFASAFAVVSLPTTRVLSYGCRAVFILWSAWVILVARTPYGASISSTGIADERQWYVARGRIARPVMLDDYSFHSFHRVGIALDQLVRQKNMRAFYWAHIGIAVAALSTDVVVVDPLTLNDAIGSHVALETRGRPGHEKTARAAWFTARYPPGVGVVIRNQRGGAFKERETEESVQAARTVLQSTVVSEIVDATTSPMSATLFIKNITRAWRLTHLRFPNDPIEALRTLPQRN
jgi:arabinofuranosyltransferase